MNCGLHLVIVLIALVSGHTANASDRELFFDWRVSYSKRSPLGVDKKVIAINDQFPGPLMNLTTNDVVYVNVFNGLDEPFLLTWSGVRMRRNSWSDGVAGTNCPIPPGRNWTYAFQVKDQVGSFFYYPSLGLHAAAGGHGPLRINNRRVIAVPFARPHGDLDVLIGDWYNIDMKAMRESIDEGRDLPPPDGILINGLGPYGATVFFKPGHTYRLRVSNVGAKTSLNFYITGHKMLLVEAEGSYTLQQYYSSLLVHVGQSVSVLVTADQRPGPYYMIAASCFVRRDLFGVANVLYAGSGKPPSRNAHLVPSDITYERSMEQAKSTRLNLTTGAARPNPQGSFHYGRINITRTAVLRNDVAVIDGQRRCTVNAVSFSNPDTPLKLADYFRIDGVFTVVSGMTDDKEPALGAPVIDARYKKDFAEIVFENSLSTLQTWHLDGYSFYVAGMGSGKWSPDARSTYNLVDAIHRSTVEVYPKSWTAVLVYLDNEAMWNIRSQDVERRYLGQEIYMRVSSGDGSVPHSRDEMPKPANVLLCGKALNS